MDTAEKQASTSSPRPGVGVGVALWRRDEGGGGEASGVSSWLVAQLFSYSARSANMHSANSACVHTNNVWGWPRREGLEADWRRCRAKGDGGTPPPGVVVAKRVAVD